jgi:RHS repeat-associated protein
LSAGAVHSLATAGSGVIWVWGGNQTGQLGDGTTTSRATPRAIGQPQATAVSAGGVHSLAIALDNSAWAWGNSLLGQIGDGGTGTEKVPVPISGPDLGWGVTPPVFTPAAGAYSEPISVFIATPTPGATVRYTTNGIDPAAGDPVLAPGQSVAIGSPTTVKARGFKTGMAPSATATAVYTFALGTLAAPVAAPPAGTYQEPQSVTLTADAGATIRVTLDGTDPVETSPLYSGAIAIASTTTLKAGAFRSGYAPSPILTAAYIIDSPPDDGIPPDPATVAPPLDPTVPTAFADATSFLYTGPHPIQRGVEEGAIVRERVAVVRGQVRNRAGAPLAGVRITVLNQAKLGHTLSRDDGMYDLAVNGGGPLVIEYALDGFLPVQRTLSMPWNDFLVAPDVLLTALDPQVTVVEFGVNAPAQTARGTAVSDADGPRQATLIVPEGGVVANIELADGSMLPALSRLSIRATEYTVGPGGRAAMPANLPPASGYTYAVELSADEAIQAGATRVTFAPALAFYVENFLGFPVGGAVPVGYYDRKRGEWVASPNGRIVRVLNTDGAGRAELDINGDGQADSAAALAALGITDGERQKVATLYQPDQTLWRVSIQHFTPWDCNWPYALPPDARPPNVSSPRSGNDQSHKGCEAGGSIIECENQTLGERLPIAGTSVSLNYRSSRQAGREAARTAEVTLTSGTVSPSLRNVELEVTIAGQRRLQTFAPTETKGAFKWDGKDVYGRQVYGSQPATVVVKHVYPAVYTEPAQFASSFALAGGAPISADRNRNEIRLEQSFDMKVGSGLAPDSMIGGWSLDVHHQFDPKGGLVSFGDGSRRDSAAAGFDVKPFGRSQGAQSDLLAARADGSAIINNPFSNGLLSLGRDGSEGGIGFRGLSGVPAVCIGPESSRAIVITEGPGEQLYYAISNVGFGTTGYATHLCAGRVGDDGFPVNLATITLPQLSYLALARIAVDRAGVIYATAGPYIYQIAPGGSPALIAQAPGGVTDQAVTGDGSFYFTTGGGSGLPGQIYRRMPSGQIVLMAGAATGSCEAPRVDGLATPQTVICPAALTATGDGTVIFTDTAPDGFQSTSSIRRLSPDGFITTVLLGPFASSMKLAPNGEVYMSAGRVQHLVPTLEASLSAQQTITSDDGTEVYDFDPLGRHLRTVDTSTGVTLYTFGYDANGYLTSITDRAGLKILIERSASGTPLAIVAPFGQRTTLAINADGYLSTVTDPAGAATSLSYDGGGLLTELIRPGGHRYQFGYDADGRLTSDTDPAGGVQRLDRTETPSGWTVALQNNSGQAREYRIDNTVPERPKVTATLPDGTVSTREQLVDGFEQVAPDGTKTRIVTVPDQRFGRQAMAPAAITVTTPSGLRRETTLSRSVLLANASDPLSVRRIDQTAAFNGRIYQRTYDATTRVLTTTSPAGRQTRTEFDALGRTTKLTTGSLLPTTFTYTAQGGVNTVTRGSRTTTFGYDARGLVVRKTDPMSRMAEFRYDLAGRMTSRSLPGQRTVGFEYDVNGNILSITPPGRTAHTFTYSSLDQIERYDPPGGGGTTFTYGPDRQPLLLTRSDGQVVASAYDAAGRLATVTMPSGALRYTYDASSGRIKNVEAPDATVAYSYDGGLLTEERWSGGVNGRVGWTFDANFRVVSERVGNETPIAFQYDADGLLTRAGAATLTRTPSDGFVSGVAAAGVTTAYGYDATGATASRVTTVGGVEAASATYIRDALGRIQTKTETILGVTRIEDYTYDAAGRLIGVTRNGAPFAAYTYDINGNRLTATTAAGTSTAAYDGQDRLLSTTGATYAYTPSGRLLTRTQSTGTTTYGYDGLGNLTSVTLPDSTVVSYLHDAGGRRIGRRVNGLLTHAFVYQGRLRPVAEVDASGAVLTRYVYGTDANVPEYFVRGGVTYRVVTDQLGSPRLIVNTATGAIVQQIDYDPFGHVVQDNNPGFQPFGFAGGLYDPQTGLTRFGARDYDGQIGRWICKDPIHFGGGDFNLYAYTFNDPVNKVDPNGLDAIDTGLKWGTDLTAGFGDGVSGGLTHWIRESLGWNSVVNECSGLYTAGWWGGAATATATAGAGSFWGGARSVFYSGGSGAAYEAALAGKGTGILLEETLGGRAMTFVSENIMKLPDAAWEGASAIYAANAKGVAQVFLREPVNPNGIFMRIERPILETLGNAVMQFK